MAKIQNISGRTLEVPSLGGRIVAPEQAVEVAVEAVTGFTQQEGTWAAYDKAAKQAHADMLAAIAELLGAEAPTTTAAASVDTPSEEK